MSAALDAQARQWLLWYARRSIHAHLEGAEPPEAQPPAAAQVPCGCFVTLHTQAGMLRGCIGIFEGPEPLFRNVAAMARAAATDDPRFAPMQASELARCTLEISVLTARVPAQAQDVRVGEHGVWVMRGGHRGVLLPQVAVAEQWDRETFLDHTCIKAGLAKNAWRDGSVQIYTFTAEVFSEVE